MRQSLRTRAIAIAVLGPVLLVACSPAAPSATSPSAAAAQPNPAGSTSGPTREDTQGAVTFEITPLNLLEPGATLDFAVDLTTHSVDLAWDLAELSTLTTDTGLRVASQAWPRSEGHHVEGVLSFPTETAEGRSLLAGARTLTLTIRDTDVAERTFVWNLSP